MTKPDINRLIQFQRLLVEFAHVERVTHRKHKDSIIKENDIEHSYNLAMSAWFLVQYFPELDRDTVIRLALVHDIVEVHAGDTYIYGSEQDLASKTEREEKALKKLENDWDDFPELTQLIHDYEMRDSNESRFVYALDKIMPIMLIYITDGYTWKQEGINLEQLDSKKRDKTQLSPEIHPYYEQLYELLVSSPHLIPPN
jgi:putative hydrolase of HD superfamily